MKSFKGFSKLKRAERYAALKEMGCLTAKDVAHLEAAAQKDLISLSEDFIENVIGCYALPLGVAGGFVIDGLPKVIPMAVEETSIIAALCKTARWISLQGSITTKIIGSNIIGQLQIQEVDNFERLSQVMRDRSTEYIDYCNKNAAASFFKRGGGVKHLRLRHIQRNDGKAMAVIHVEMDPCDAMGANVINQVCESLKAPIESATGEKINLCIVSNLVDTKLTSVEVLIKDCDPVLGKSIEEASLFAELDPYRAATHNKGILNGIDGVLIATGNDWRAVEAGIHAYAAKDGQYRGVSKWFMRGKDLVGEMVAPIVVGTVGGVTQLHPTAKLCVKMLGVQHADELSRIIAAVGLVQNLGALKALATNGIVEGHMKLHVQNLVVGVGAQQEERPILAAALIELLKTKKRITLTDAKKVLSDLRKRVLSGAASLLS